MVENELQFSEPNEHRIRKAAWRLVASSTIAIAPIALARQARADSLTQTVTQPIKTTQIETSQITPSHVLDEDQMHVLQIAGDALTVGYFLSGYGDLKRRQEGGTKDTRYAFKGALASRAVASLGGLYLINTIHRF